MPFPYKANPSLSKSKSCGTSIIGSNVSLKSFDENGLDYEGLAQAELPLGGYTLWEARFVKQWRGSISKSYENVFFHNLIELDLHTESLDTLSIN